MITLRDLVRTDTAIASISTDDCHFIAAVLELFYWFSQHFLLKYLLPKTIRKKSLSLRMLAAVFGRTPSERQSKDIAVVISMAMAKDWESKA